MTTTIIIIRVFSKYRSYIFRCFFYPIDPHHLVLYNDGALLAGERSEAVSTFVERNRWLASQNTLFCFYPKNSFILPFSL